MSASTAPKLGRAEDRVKRRKMFARIHCQWKDLRPDLHNDPESLREGLLDYATAVLGVEVTGLSTLSTGRLGKLLDAMREERSQPSLPGALPGAARFKRAPSDSPGVQNAPAEIVHLASTEQVWAIQRVLNFLGWTAEGAAKFIKARFGRESATFLKPRQANDLLMILLTIACSAELKRENAEWGSTLKVSRQMIRAYIPKLKQRLGIDQAPKEQS